MPLFRRAFVANFVPALLLWSGAGLLVALYFLHDPTHEALGRLAGWKAQLGLGFSMPAQALVSAVLPFGFQHLQRGSHRRTRARDLPFLMLVFALLGAATDSFYRAQALVWGSGTGVGTLVLKTACDMLLYSLFFSVPYVVACFALKDCNYSLAATRAFLGRDWFRTRVLPVYLSAVVVWLPAVTLLYTLPLALQFPFQAVVACLWALILSVLTDAQG